jgi:hypothetical protein
MRLLALALAVSFAALAQQSAPPRLFIEPGHSTSAALIKQCPKVVAVTDQRETAQYRLDLIWEPGFPTQHTTGILYNKDGLAVAHFRGGLSVTKFARQICAYFEK